MGEKKSAQIIHLFGQDNTAAGRDAVDKSKAAKLSIEGSHNVGVVGDSNHVQITVQRGGVLKRQITPGPGEISNEQAAEIKHLVNEIALRSGQAHARVYGALYKHVQATSYLMIKRERYEEAVAYLRRWLARFPRGVLPAGAEEQRKFLLKRIHAEARKRRDCLVRIHAYIQGRFGTASLADLAPGQLHEVIKEFRL